jgi:ribonuclease VapC
VIIDTSALIEIVKGQPEAERCFSTLLDADIVRLSAAGLLEVYLVADGLDDPDAGAKATRILRLGRITVEPVTEAQVLIAREASLRYGRGRHPAKLNFGDCFAYALAKQTGEPLLFVGNDFGQTDVGIA